MRPLPFALVALSLLTACPSPEVCRDGEPPAVQPAEPQGAAGYLPYGHSHNDYEQERPLEEALDRRLYSLEVDLFLDGGELVVKHNFWDPAKGTLEALYLDPLQALVDERGSVHGDGLPVTLWVDLKDGGAELQDALAATLSRYDMLTSFAPGATTPGPVAVVLTGDRGGKVALGERAAPRPYAIDSNDYGLDDPLADDRWRYYALNWGSYIGWNGEGEPSDEVRRRLSCVVGNAHESGRRVRFYAAPETRAAWQLMLETGTDFLGADDLEELTRFLTAYAP